jgi:hypothetical protein
MDNWKKKLIHKDESEAKKLKNDSAGSQVLSLFSFFVVLGFELRVYTLIHLEPLHQTFFQDRVSQTICLGWLQTMILLISAS